jgi:hypothetical protein
MVAAVEAVARMSDVERKERDPVTRYLEFLSAHHTHRVVLYIALVTTLMLAVQIFGLPWAW